MSSEDDDVYIMSEGDQGEEWVSPTPVGTAVAEAVSETTDVEESDLDDLGSYVDIDDVRSLLAGEGGETLTFDIEGHDVTIHADGEIDVE